MPLPSNYTDIPTSTLLNTVTAEDTSYRSLATVLAKQATEDTVLTNTDACVHTRVETGAGVGNRSDKIQ